MTCGDSNIFQWVTEFYQLVNFVVRKTGIGVFRWAAEKRWSLVPFRFVSWTGICCIHRKRIASKLSLEFINNDSIQWRSNPNIYPICFINTSLQDTVELDCQYIHWMHLIFKKKEIFMQKELWFFLFLLKWFDKVLLRPSMQMEF